MLDGLWFFELGDDPCVGLEGGQAILYMANVIGSADEGDGDGIYPLSDGKNKVLFVLFSEGGNVDCDAGKINSFVFAEHAAVDDLADDVNALNGLDVQFNKAIGEQDAG